MSNESRGFGIFEGDAVAGFDQVEAESTPDGYKMTRDCESCGREQSLLISWPEVLCVASSVFPQQVGMQDTWAYHQKLMIMFPQVQCGCQGKLMFPMTPQQAKKILTDAVNNGQISAQANQAMQALRGPIAQIMQAQGRRS